MTDQDPPIGINDHGNIEINTAYLVSDSNPNSPDLVAQLGKDAAFNFSLATSVVDLLLDEQEDDGLELDPELAVLLRKRLLSKMPKAVGLMVKDLEDRVTAANGHAERFANMGMRLSRAWQNMDDEKRRQIANPDSPERATMTQEEAIALVQEAIDFDKEVSSSLDLPEKVEPE